MNRAASFMKTVFLLIVLMFLNVFYRNATATAQEVYTRKANITPAMLATHGAYYSIEDTHTTNGTIFHSVLFYNDGTFYIGGHIYETDLRMKKILDSYNDPWQDRKSLDIQDAWGSYYISNDTIYMERFSVSAGDDYSNKTMGMVAVINNETSFTMMKETCNWCGVNEYFGEQGHIYEEPVEYKYYPLERLPDASLAWFHKKDWFLKGNVYQNTFAITKN